MRLDSKPYLNNKNYMTNNDIIFERESENNHSNAEHLIVSKKNTEGIPSIWDHPSYNSQRLENTSELTFTNFLIGKQSSSNRKPSCEQSGRGD
jgi:hypothetical protein